VRQQCLIDATDCEHAEWSRRVARLDEVDVMAIKGANLVCPLDQYWSGCGRNGTGHREVSVRITFLVVLALALSVLAGSAQEHLSFDGTWRLVPSRSTYLNDQGEPFTVYVFNEFFSIRQTPDTLTTIMEPLVYDQRPKDDCGLKTVYRLDGTATENCMGADHQRVQATARWSGSTLVLTVGTVERNGPIEPWQLHFTLTLNDDGTLRAEAPWGRDHAMIASVYRRVR